VIAPNNRDWLLKDRCCRRPVKAISCACALVIRDIKKPERILYNPSMANDFAKSWPRISVTTLLLTIHVVRISMSRGCARS
jgi:hypothetical protein